MDGARIMIVEDNATVAEDCRECLEGCGFNVTSIWASGEEAVANAERERPDAVLMDIKLRGEMDGVEAAARIYTRLKIPVVFLSAYSDRDLLQRAKQVGSFGYLVKPFNERELYAMLETTLFRAAAEKERRQMEAQLQKMRKMEAIGRLAGGVAHDLNNMLAIILGYTQSAMEELDPDGPINQDLGEVLNAARRSSDLVKKLLTFARKEMVVPKILNLNREVQSRLGKLGRIVGEKVELVWTPTEELWPIKLDPSQIDQILFNLCANARDAISTRGRITIKTGTATFDMASNADQQGTIPGDFVLLAIMDDGNGMDRETLENLFEPFYTTKGLGRGIGLDLAAVYGIVKQNHGFIKVNSQPKQGSTFNIYLPRYIPKTKDAAAMQASEQKSPKQSKTILLVEDEPAILKMTGIMLTRQGYKLLSAQTPEEAIRLAKDHEGELDLLITDVVMPKMNGQKLAEILLSHYPKLKCLFMSGHTADVIDNQGLLDSVTQFIRKPFSQKDLQTKVSDILFQAMQEEPSSRSCRVAENESVEAADSPVCD